MLRARPLLVVGALALAACDACEGEGTPVPFGTDSGAAATGTADEDPRPPPTTPFEPQQGSSFEDGTQRVAVQGSPIVTGEGSIRALLALDLDGDGDRDALVLTAEGGGIALAHARREGSAFADLRELASMVGSESGCSVTSAGLRTVAPAYAVATAERSCEDAGRFRSVWILSIEAQPRVRESVTLMPERDRARGEVSIGLRSLDQDEDGHTDVVLDVGVTPPEGSEAATASIAWLDRPGGLARDTREPEATLAALALEAKRELEGDPEQALATARRALALHAALCREAARPRVRFGDSDGLACRVSEGAGRAAAVAAAAWARQGEVFEALEAASRLEAPGYRVTGPDRRAAEEALADMARSELEVTTGPPVPSPPAPDVHLPPVHFLDEATLATRGDAPSAWDISAGAITPVAEPPPDLDGSVLVRDPSGRHAVADVVRTCEGFHLKIVRASEIAAGVVAGRAVAEPLLEPAPPPPGTRCPEVPRNVREDDGGWRVVGWAPQGVVAVRRDEVRLVPLTVDARPAGEPTVLEPDTPTPAPVPPGNMNAEASVYVLSTPHGIVLRRMGGGDAVLLRPEGWPEDGAPVAVSPSGDRVVFVAEGRARIVTVR